MKSQFLVYIWKNRIKLDLQSAGSRPNLTYTKSSALNAHVIFVTAQGPNPSFFLFIRLLFDLGAFWDQDLDQGLTTDNEINLYN